MTKILVLDDSKLMRRYLRQCLENHGIEVDDCTPLSALEIPDRIQAAAPDLILSDFHMPGCNGASIARIAHASNPGLPLIILTSFPDEDMQTKLTRWGVRQILIKPIETSTLIQSIYDILHGPDTALQQA